MNNISKSKDLGRKAHSAGQKCIPIQDGPFIDLLKSRENRVIDTAIPLLKAWIRGWNEANLGS